MVTTAPFASALAFITVEMPFWTLSKKELYDRDFKMVGKFMGSPDGSSPEETFRMATDELTSKVGLFSNPGTIFSLSTKKSFKDGEDRSFGPMFFVGPNSSQVPQTQMGGLAGLGGNGMAYDSMLGNLYDKRESFLLEQTQTLADINRREMDLVLKNREFELKKERWEEDKKKAEKELEELRKTYESHSKKVENGIVMGIGKAFSYFLNEGAANGALGTLEKTLANPGVGNVPTPPAGPGPEVEEPETPFEKAMANLGDLIEEKFPTEEEVLSLTELVEKLADNKPLISNFIAQIDSDGI